MNIKKRELAILLALSLTSALTGCGVSSQSSASSAVARTAEGIQGETAPEELQAADQTGMGKIPTVSSANLTEEEAANPVPDKFHVELEEVSRVNGKDNYQIRGIGLQHIEDDSCTFCDFSGTPVDPRPVHTAYYLGWDLYSVTLKSEDDINCTGLVDTTGNVLIPFDAAVIEFPPHRPETERPRYVLVYTGTEVTSNEDEALFPAWKYMSASITTDKKVFYKGLLRVFDLETGQYVNGLEYTHANKYSIKQVGDNLFTNIEDKAVVYSPSGEVIYTEQDHLDCNYRFMVDRTNGQHLIMDANGSRLYTAENYLGTLNYNSKYFYTVRNDRYDAVDCRGDTVLPDQNNLIVGESKDRFIISNGKSGDTLVAKDGSVIASANLISTSNALGFLTFGAPGNYSLVTPGNRVFKGLDSDSRFLVFTKDDEAFYLVLNTGEFVPSSAPYIFAIGKGVLTFQNSEHKYKLVDVFTGNDLSGFDYDRAWYINDDYLYVEEGDDIVIYRPVLVPEG